MNLTSQPFYNKIHKGYPAFPYLAIAPPPPSPPLSGINCDMFSCNYMCVLFYTIFPFY